MTSPAVASIPTWVTDRMLRVRYVVIVMVAIAFGVLAGGRGDWNQFASVGRDLFGAGGWHVYERHLDVQTGPITLALARMLAWTPKDGFVVADVLSGLAGVLSIVLVERAGVRRWPHDVRRVHLLTLVGGSTLAVTWAQLGGFGHLDDALVLLAAACCLTDVVVPRTGTSAATARRFRLAAPVSLGLAIAVKPWAVIFLPILCWPAWQHRPSRAHLRRTVQQLAIALAIAAVAWLPFVLLAPRTLDSLKPTVSIAESSVLGLIGTTEAGLVGGFRAFQLALALLAGLLMIVRRRPAGVVLVAIAFRIVTDPGAWGYYTPGLILGALALEVLATRRILPWLAIVLTLGMTTAAVGASPTVQGWCRLVTLTAAIVAALVSAPAPSAAPSNPSSDPSAAG